MKDFREGNDLNIISLPLLDVEFAIEDFISYLR
jgi:hypothetical protein